MGSTAIDQLREAVSNDLPFVLYHLPGQEKLTVLIQKSRALKFEPFKKIDKLQGFFVAPFRGDPVNQLICLTPDVMFEEMPGSSDLESAFEVPLPGLKNEDGPAYAMNKQEYIDRVAYLVELLKDGALRKVVLSRVADYPLIAIFNPANYLSRLMNTYPDAFVYLANLPGHGVWVGATPEVLLQVVGGHAETVALAGTQPAQSPAWTEKEVREQQIVMDYIEEQLSKHGIEDFEKKGPYAAIAGEIAHLKTEYSLALTDIEGHMGDVVAGLHPTPAVCGLPRNKAYSILSKIEKHDRAFYSGFIGPWGLNGESRLFVNLRCAQLTNDRISLFVGGGITAESNPEAEWEETVRKTKTLLAVVEKM